MGLFLFPFLPLPFLFSYFFIFFIFFLLFFYFFLTIKEIRVNFTT